MFNLICCLYSNSRLLGKAVSPLIGKYLRSPLCPQEGHSENVTCSPDGHHNDLPNGLIYMISATSWTVQNTEKYLEWIHQVPARVQIKLVVSSVGGYYNPCFHLVRHLQKHPAGYVVYVYDQCLSAGTFMALGAREIVMDSYSRLGKIDPVGMTANEEACRYSKDFETSMMLFEKDIPTLKEYVEVRGNQDWVNYVEEELKKLFENNLEMYSTIRARFIHSPLPHMKVFYYEECLKLGLKVRLPTEEEKRYFRWKTEK
jgi:hypothetical protein